MTDNEADPSAGSQSRRSSLVTSPAGSAAAPPPAAPASDPAPGSDPAAAATPAPAPAPAASPKKRALPPPPMAPSLRPGTSRRTSYTIPAAASASASSSSAAAKPTLEVKYHVSVGPAHSTYTAAPADGTTSGPSHSTYTPAYTDGTAVEPSRSHSTYTPAQAEGTTVEVLPAAASSPHVDGGALPPTSYRSPEAVVEHVEDADAWTSSLPPGVLAVNEGDDDSAGGWGPGLSAFSGLEDKPRVTTPGDGNMMMDIDDADLALGSAPDRPQIGPGLMARAWFGQIHEHKLYRPIITNVPSAQSTTGKTPPARQASLVSDGGGGGSAATPSASSTSAAEDNSDHEPLTLDDVLEALPGGKAGQGEWYFCPECWGWYHIDKDDVYDPQFPSMEEWERTAAVKPDQDAHAERLRELGRYRDLTAARGVSEHKDLHFHAFENLVMPTAETRIPRVDVPGHEDQFFHLQLEEQPVRFSTYATPKTKPKLWMSCTSDHWVFIDQGPVCGQLPFALVREFGFERENNPQLGQDPKESIVQAWSLVLTLLQNPLFKRKRGWVKLTNPTFQNKIGASLLSSHLMYQIGFACTELPGEGYRIGPFNVSDQITEEDVIQMDRYMARTWVEVSLSLQAYQQHHGLTLSNVDCIKASCLQDEISEWLDIPSIRTLSIKFETGPYAKYLEDLGVLESDVTDTVAAAYDMQISDDFRNAPKYLSALEKLSNAHVPGVETLQIKVATDRSLERYSLEDLDDAYGRIGITKEYVEGVMVDREDIPNEVVLDMHRKAMDATSSSSSRAELGRALGMIGRERNDPIMAQLARNGGVYLSLEQAYKEFNTTREAGVDDEMLIMQYDTWIQDRPSRADHYRTALSIIANAPGEERPLLQAFLQGKDVSEFQPPARRDIPTGLRNIGNTCYLNSVLQFLYAVKPVRDTVMAFEQPVPAVPNVEETERDMEKRIKIESSRRFVGLLRELFEQMYTTSAKAVVPTEELARLAILPVDLVGERKDAVPVAPKSRVTIDSLPTILSPDVSSSGAATAADSPAHSPPSTSPSGSPATRTSSILGKRASHDRESAFGGSEERLRRLTSSSEENLINLDDSERMSPEPQANAASDVDMSPPAREGSELPNTSLAQLGITSPVAETGSSSADRDASATTEGATSASSQPTPGPIGPAPPPLPPRRDDVARRQSVALVAAEKFGLQQDAAEILINVLAQLELAFDVPTEGEDGPSSSNFISSLFSAKFRQQRIMQSADGSSTESQEPVESVFVHPIIGVEEDGKDLYDCLGELYLGGAEIEYEGKKGFKMDLIDELPPLLYIQMRRSQYDYAKRTQTKTNTHIAFDRTLVMDRFLAGADREKRERSITLTRQLMAMRARRHELRNHKPMSIPDTFRFVAEALAADSTVSALGIQRESSADLSSLADDLSPDILDALTAQASLVDAEIADLERGITAHKGAIEDLWAGHNEVEYELVSVFVHGGTGTGGHYWTYQANLPSDGNTFFYYSDETVKPVDADDVFADKSAKGISPALLCYVRKDRDLVDTLHREAAPAGLEGNEEQSNSTSTGMPTATGTTSGEWTPYAGSGHGPIALP